MKLPRTPRIPPLPAGKTYHVVGLGTNVVDRVAMVSRISGPDEKVTVASTETHPGGAVCNNLAQAARLGMKTAWVGFLGSDPEGRYLVRKMGEAGVDASHSRALRGKRTSVSWIAVGPDGERAIYMFPNANGTVEPRHVERYWRGVISSCAHFHAEAAQTPLRTVIAAMRIAREAGARVLFDLDVPLDDLLFDSKLGTEAELEECFRLCHVLKPCKKAAIGLTRKRNLEGAALELLKTGPELVAITDGAHGALLATRHEMVKAPAVKMRAKDTTGAGDAFMGGLSFAVYGKEPLARAGLIANACAAYCVARVGSRSQGTYDDVRALLSTIPAY